MTDAILPPATSAVMAWMLFAHITVIVGLDVWLAHTPGRTTITHYIRETASRHPIVAVVAGAIIGHLFWSGD